MKWLTFEVQRAPGFRLNLTDLALLLILCLLSLSVRMLLPESSLYVVPLYVGLSFFLFCNVFRIGIRLEAWWYVPFTAVAIYGVLSDDMATFWWAVLLFLEPLKWGLIVHRIRKGPYYGIMYHKLRTGHQPL